MEWPSLSELVAQLKSGKQKPTELVKACLEAAKKAEQYNAITELNPKALEQAKKLESGNQKGRLYGVPFVAKDNFLTANTKTTAASNILKNFAAPYQATVIEKLEAEGAILLGKANLDAFAHGSTTEHSDVGPTKNPVDPSRVPGGSSGGSAAAVALNLAGFALGTDTGGSIRLPASFSGVVGLKPTYGLVSRYGVIAMASSTDVVGPLARSVADSAFVLDVLAGKDSKDSTTIDRAKGSYTDISQTNLRIGIVKEHLSSGVDEIVKDRVQNMANKLAKAGHKVSEISLPYDELALAAYYIVQPAEVSSNLARYDGVKYGYFHSEAQDLAETYDLSRSHGFGTEAKRRILIGTYVLSSGYYDAYYKKAQTVRTLLVKSYQQAFSKVDVMIGPTAASTAFEFGAKPDPVTMYQTDVMTVAANLVGIPAISVPIGQADGLPVGMQIMAAQGQEKTMLAAAKAVEGLA